MHIHISYDIKFTELIKYLKEKYGEDLFNMDGIGYQTDISMFSKDFFKSKSVADASVDANANVDDINNIVYNVELPKPYFRLNSYYILWKYLRKLYNIGIANSIIEKQLAGDIYINDFHGIASGSPYCFNYSSYDIMLLGLPMIKKIRSVPPKHLYSFKSQLEQFIVVASNSTLGATGIADLFIVMSYYVKNILNTKSDAGFTFNTEADCWKYVRENIASFIYTINQPMRANQSPFTNVSVYDSEFLNSLCPNYIFPDGTQPDIDIVKAIQELYLDIMNEELERTPITFPITTACFAKNDKNEILDKDFIRVIARKNMKFGFINIYTGKSSTLSSCCRLRSETDNEYFNSFGAGSTKIGSLGVCTINLPRLAFKHSGNKDEFLRELKDLVIDCSRVNNTKRYIIQKRIDNNNLPLYTHGFMELNKQYSTCGINGVNEACEIMGYDILTEEGQDFVISLLNMINTTNEEKQKLYKTPHNCEQIPGENVSIKLASKDRLLGYNSRYNIYSNQFIPLTTKADLLDRIYLQGMFDAKCSGGAIGHFNIEQRIEDENTLVDLIEVCAKYGVIYWAMNYNLQRCDNYHMSVGRSNICTICGEPIVDNYTRVVGFLTSTKNWHKVRREEDYPNRQFY